MENEVAAPIPSIGRIVIYQPGSDDPGSNGQPCPAVITRVWSDTCVNLQVLSDSGPVFFRTSVCRDYLPEGTGQTRHSWRWPPRV